MRMLREGAGLDSQATADDCCPTVIIYSGATKKRLGKGFCFLVLQLVIPLLSEMSLQIVSYIFSFDEKMVCFIQELYDF